MTQEPDYNVAKIHAPGIGLEQAVLDVHLEEYKQLSSEIKLRIDFQQKLTNYELLAVGIVVTLGVRISQLEPNQIVSSGPVRYFLLLSPLLFLVFSWMFSNIDLMILAAARYIQQYLTPEVRFLLKNNKLLRFEEYMEVNRKTLVQRYGLLPLVGQEFAFQFLLPIIFWAIFIYLYVSDLVELLRGQNKLVRLPEVAVLVCGIWLYIITLRMRFRIFDGYKSITSSDS